MAQTMDADAGRRPYRIAPTPEPAPVVPTFISRVDISVVDVAFVAIVAVTVVTYLRWSRGSFFSADDWPLARRGLSPHDLVEPYNQQLSIIVIGLYRAMYKVFGFDSYVPWRIAGLTCLLAVPVSLYLLLRNKTGPLVAGVVASYVLWFPHTSFVPSLLNHYLVLVAAIACAWALGRGQDSSNLIIFGALAFALCSAGGGLAVAAACFVYAACTLARARRWVAILLPTALWFAWWLKYSRESNRPPAFFRLDTSGIVHRVFDGVRASFDALAFSNRYLGAILAIAFLLHLGWRLRAGLASAANALAWTVALATWWAMLAYSRGTLADVHAFRYQFVGAVFIILAMVPPVRLSLPSLTRAPVAALALVVAVGVIVLVNQGAIADGAAEQRATARATIRQLIVANIGPTIVPDSYRFDLNVGNLTAGEYRRAIDLYGLPPGTKSASPDQAVVDLGGVPLTPAATPATPCTKPNGGLVVPGGRTVLVQATTRPGHTVRVRRFGAAYLTIGVVPAGKAVTVQLPGFGAAAPWLVIAPDACISVAPPEGTR